MSTEASKNQQGTPAAGTEASRSSKPRKRRIFMPGHGVVEASSMSEARRIIEGEKTTKKEGK